MKRVKSVEDLVDLSEKKCKKNFPFDEEQLDALFAALCMVRESGRFNTVMEFSSCWVAAMCILAMWKRRYIVILMNRHAKADILLEIRKRWKNGFEEHHKSWENLAHSMPLGKYYLEALEHWNQDHTTEKTKKFIEMKNHHRLSISKALTCIALEKCREKGIFARDVTKVECLRGCFRNDSDLQSVGAQLL